MSTVYIIQASIPGGHRKATYDTTPAEQYGQIRYIFEGSFSPSAQADKAISIAHKALENFNSDEDYIVWAGGDPAGMLIVGALAYHYSLDGDVKFLKWENNRDPETRQANGSGHYIPVTMRLASAALASGLADHFSNHRSNA